MKSLAAAVSHWFAELLALWNRFWFEPADPATLGIIRICAGAMLFYTHAVWALDLMAFFGPHSWLSPEAVQLLLERVDALRQESVVGDEGLALSG